jgi:hypothetical protein
MLTSEPLIGRDGLVTIPQYSCARPHVEKTSSSALERLSVAVFSGVSANETRSFLTTIKVCSLLLLLIRSWTPWSVLFELMTVVEYKTSSPNKVPIRSYKSLFLYIDGTIPSGWAVSPVKRLEKRIQVGALIKLTLLLNLWLRYSLVHEPIYKNIIIKRRENY